jgi:hypothetical protein
MPLTDWILIDVRQQAPRNQGSTMNQYVIDYHIADVGQAWGIFREGVQIAIRKDAGDAIAFANFFADRETRIAAHTVRVSADRNLHRTLSELRRAA